MTQSLKSVIPLPLSVAAGIVLSLVFLFFIGLPEVANVMLLLTVLGGSAKFLSEIVQAIIRRQFALDYIALAAILTSLLTGEYLVGAVIVLMLTTGDALEAYASLRARQSLTALIDRIPKTVSVLGEGQTTIPMDIEQVEVGQYILIRRGEVIPLDGVLRTQAGLVDESSLTGEPYLNDKVQGDVMRSGTVNVVDVMEIEVTKPDRESTYRKIIELVQAAEQSQAPLVRLADRYSVVFTWITVALCVFAYVISRDVNTVLAVLVVATPCPLLLATPIALIGGMSASAKQKIILKNLSSLEVLSRVNTIVFDKTGTITLGQPSVTAVRVHDSTLTEQRVLAIAAAIEHNSLHPLAKAIVQHAKAQDIELVRVTDVKEVIGQGISGSVDGARYTLARLPGTEGIVIALNCNDQLVAQIELEDQIKTDSKDNLRLLERAGFHMLMMTGDKQAVADKVVATLGAPIEVQANCSPEDKMQRVKALKQSGKVTAMVGDGINDAPALAIADVGIVFSNEQHTAASEAADIVLLGGDFSHVLNVFNIARRTIKIALQSIWVGIGLSVASMVLAAFGLIPPLLGSIWQECIDVLVIINALRASR